jgi:hypothetical protein
MPINPPGPSPAGTPITCDAPTNWLKQTAFVGAELVDFGDKGIVNASSAAECCGIW